MENLAQRAQPSISMPPRDSSVSEQSSPLLSSPSKSITSKPALGTGKNGLKNGLTSKINLQLLEIEEFPQERKNYELYEKRNYIHQLNVEKNACHMKIYQMMDQSKDHHIGSKTYHPINESYSTEDQSAIV